MQCSFLKFSPKFSAESYRTVSYNRRLRVLKKFSEKNAGNTDLCWNFLKLNSYSKSHFYQHLIVNFVWKFHSNPEIPQVNVQIERNFGTYFCINPLQSAAAVGRKHSGRNFQSFKPFNQTRVDQKCRTKRIRNVHFSFFYLCMI